MSTQRYLRSVQLHYKPHTPRRAATSHTRVAMFAALTITALLLAALVGGLLIAMKGLQ